jgi:hypothetical protein
MRHITMLLATVVGVAVGGGAARADDLAGTYDVKLEEQSTNCSPPPVSFRVSTVRIDVKQKSLLVNIDTIPQMNGIDNGTGKISAKTPKVAATTVQGLDGTYSIAGREVDGLLDLLLVAEYSTKGKPYCTQSWRVSGQKTTTKKK